MEERSKELLGIIAEQYMKHAQPVGSKFLVEQHGLEYSSATVRNEMKALEDEGYLTHPHTSAGRILTEKGWRFYVEEILAPRKLHAKHEEALVSTFQSTDDHEQATKSVAKHLAETLDETVFVAFNPNSSFYTGLSNLFRKPEFARQDLVVNISEVVDHFDDVLEQLYDKVDAGEVRILVGSESLFGPACSTILGKTHGNQLVGLLGPMRMSYGLNKAHILKTIEFYQDAAN